MDKTLKIVIILVCVSMVLLAIVGWTFLSFLLNLPDTRGLRLAPYMHTTSVNYFIVENTRNETAFISKFYDENNSTIEVLPWNGTCCVLPSGELATLFMHGQYLHSHEIYVEFYDGYKCKLGNV
jgi:hypothetical protein